MTGALLRSPALLILVIALDVGNDSNEGHLLLLDTLSHQIELVKVGVLRIGAHVAMVCLFLG